MDDETPSNIYALIPIVLLVALFVCVLRFADERARGTMNEFERDFCASHDQDFYRQGDYLYCNNSDRISQYTKEEMNLWNKDYEYNKVKRMYMGDN